jgi:hypothetical protein
MTKKPSPISRLLLQNLRDTDDQDIPAFKEQSLTAICTKTRQWKPLSVESSPRSTMLLTEVTVFNIALQNL